MSNDQYPYGSYDPQAAQAPTSASSAGSWEDHSAQPIPTDPQSHPQQPTYAQQAGQYQGGQYQGGQYQGGQYQGGQYPGGQHQGAQPPGAQYAQGGPYQHPGAYQQQPYAAPGTQPWVSAPASDDGFGAFFKGLFTFDFKDRNTTHKMAKFAYLISLIAVILVWLGSAVFTFLASQLDLFSYGYTSTPVVVMAILIFVLGWIPAVAVLGLARMAIDRSVAANAVALGIAEVKDSLDALASQPEDELDADDTQ